MGPAGGIRRRFYDNSSTSIVAVNERCDTRLLCKCDI